MTADCVPPQISLDPQGGRILDTAQGILIGLRRCHSEAAFQELLATAQRHRVPAFAMAWALVHLACGGDKSPETLQSRAIGCASRMGPLAHRVRIELLRTAAIARTWRRTSQGCAAIQQGCSYQFPED